MVTRHPFERLASTYRYAVRSNDPWREYPPIGGMVREEQGDGELTRGVRQKLRG